MAWIDLAVHSKLFLHSARASVVSYGIIGASHFAQKNSKSRLERVIQQTATTCFASLTLGALPLVALHGTLISPALPWAPAAFIVAALATAYFAPDKTHLPLQAVEATAIALATFAAFTAPSVVTLGTLTALSAVWIQMREIPYLSATINKVMKAAGGALSAIGLLWALKESVLTFKIQYALYALIVGAISLYATHKKAKRAQETSATQAAPLQLPPDRSQRLEELYKGCLKEATLSIHNEDILKTYRQRSGTWGANTIDLSRAIAFKWLSKCTPETRALLASELNAVDNQTEMPNAPQFSSLREEWVYGTYAHSADDPRDLMSFLYSTFGKDFSVEHFLEKVHQEAMKRAIEAYLKEYAGSDVSDQSALWQHAYKAGEIRAEVMHLCRFARGITLFGGE